MLAMRTLGALREARFVRSEVSLELWGERHKVFGERGATMFCGAVRLCKKVGWPGRIKVMA